MLRKTLYSIVVFAALVVALYILPPRKKGKGADLTTAYELVKDWPDLPQDVTLGNPTGIGIDTNENIVVFHRANRKWSLFSSMPDTPITSKTILVIDKNTGKLMQRYKSEAGYLVTLKKLRTLNSLVR